MDLKERIDLKYFLVASSLVHLASCFWSQSILEFLIFTLIHISILVSFYLLMRVVNDLVETQKQYGKTADVSAFSILKMMFSHLALLIFSLSIGVHFIGNRIIISLINYSIQIFILGFALRKNLK